MVKAPPWAPMRTIEDFVGRKREWIERNQALAREKKSLQKRFVSGERFLFLGREYPLAVTDEYRRALRFEEGFFISKFYVHRGRELFEAWYKKQAQKILAERLALYAARMGLSYASMTVRSASTRWGSCSSRGSINFSWKLVLLPLDVLDYVVVHELAHLAHHNHSPRFWSLVQTYYPEYIRVRRWLRTETFHIW